MPLDSEEPNKWIEDFPKNRWKRSAKVYGTVGIIILVITLLKYLVGQLIAVGAKDERIYRIARQHPQFHVNESEVPPSDLKTILLWNSWFDWDPSFFFGVGRQPFIDAQCPVTTCYISNSRNLMPPSEYDAILFFFPMMTDVPFTYSRKSHQRYVFVNEEPPTLASRLNLSHLNGFFNLTMTFRSDSDIQWPYGKVEPRTRQDTEISHRRVNHAKGKTKLVAWFVSNCESHSKREKYVESLQKYIPVDVYGKCGNLTCWAGDQEKCYDMLEKDYKFYLSFENSFCRDYVTEKFFQLLDRQIVPIVYGAANYSSIAPKHSYIDATQMGARKLAELLKKLDSNDEHYNQYFHWKSNFHVIKDRQSIAKLAFCELCRMIHENPSKSRQVYENFQEWWDEENHCHSSGVFVTPFKSFSFHDTNLTKFKPMTFSRKLEASKPNEL